MHATLGHVFVKADDVAACAEASRLTHEAWVTEPGDRRLDVLQDPNPTQFVLYEAYAIVAGARAHQDSDHCLAWRDTVAEMTARLREGVPMTDPFPVS